MGQQIRYSRVLTIFLLFLTGRTAAAATLTGKVTDPDGAAVPDAQVLVLNLATGAEIVTTTGNDGKYRVEQLPAGSYRVSVDKPGFAPAAQTIRFAGEETSVDVSPRLSVGEFTTDVTVTATRSYRDERTVPLAVDRESADQLRERLPNSTGDALVQNAGVTPVGSGPFQVRPRLRGLDSTRVLVLVDGERLNNARTATDRAGIEVGLADLGSLESLEVVSGSGSVLYGTDALSGTINLITNQPSLSDVLKVNYGFDGSYSSNESGRRGTLSLGLSHRRFAIGVLGTIERFDNYHAGADAIGEDTHPLFASGQLHQADTIDDAFGFNFKAFPEPFNAPYVRTSTLVPVSGLDGNNLNVSGLFAVDTRQIVRVKYIRRRASEVGFPDFSEPYFFQQVSLPHSNLDRVSARYEAQSLRPWLANFKVSGYFQEQTRLLRNDFPVQFPVPSPQFFPISVFRLDILSDTQQRVRTPGLDVQGTFILGTKHLLTVGSTVYTDRSSDARTTTTSTSMIGAVTLGARGPQATVFPSPVVLGAPTVSHPVRVPDASFRDIGVFAQDEWDLGTRVHVVGGLRVDGYRVSTHPTTGYNVDSLLVGAQPPLPPDAFPDVSGETISRAALTGELGAVFRLTDLVGARAHYGRSYRHPNLEELLFAGPATVGAIVPNLDVKPETGNNLDLALTLRTSRVVGSLAYFNNTYDGFISTEIVTTTPTGPLSQAINLADVRIQGIEARGEVRLAAPGGVLTITGNTAFVRGTVLDGANPLTGVSLAGTPQDNITPFKLVGTVRYSDRRDRMWVEYGGRAQSDVTRVASTLLDSPFLIAQDLLSLEGFVLQRLAWGTNLGSGRGRLGLVFAIDNLTDTFYREQFQFAPGRGRSFTVGLSVRGS